MSESSVWHPCSQMKDYEGFPPLEVSRARGPYIELTDGRRIIDAISSWWCKSLGHAHPRLQRAATQQLERFEHVILANTSNEPIRRLSCKLAAMCGLSHVFYAGDGATAVEIACKMALRAQQLRGDHKRTGFMALDEGYHGDTAFCMGLSDQGIFKQPYLPMCPDVPYLRNLPLRAGQSAANWNDCSAEWPAIEQQLSVHADSLAAIVLEPVVQGAAGMRLYSPDLLRRLRRWCDHHGVFLIADEIMTGLGRTGKALACDHAGIHADFVCLSKGLTAGWLAFSAVVTSREVYHLFYADYDAGRAFLHSNTFCGNALAVAVALEALEIYEQDEIFERAASLQRQLQSELQNIATDTGRLTNLRGIGGLIAADLVLPDSLQHARVGYAVYQRAVELGALLRPIGNTLYWLPPLNIESDVVTKLAEITRVATRDTLHSLGLKT